MEKHNVLYSDKKLKMNIRNIDFDAINKASNIEAKQFFFLDDLDKRLTYGVIAQDVENIGLNNLVHINEDGTKGVDYISLLILKNEYLSSKLSKMEIKIQELEEKLNNFKQK